MIEISSVISVEISSDSMIPPFRGDTLQPIANVGLQVMF